MLAVEVHAEEVHFFVNGTRVSRLPRAELECDGIVGLRVNHRLDVHIGSLVVEDLPG